MLPAGARPAEIEYGVCLEFHDLTCAHAKVRQPERRRRRRSACVAYLDVAVANGSRLRRMERIGSSLCRRPRSARTSLPVSRIVRDERLVRARVTGVRRTRLSVQKHYTA